MPPQVWVLICIPWLLPDEETFGKHQDDESGYRGGVSLRSLEVRLDSESLKELAAGEGSGVKGVRRWA